jgi:hypothetical protein
MDLSILQSLVRCVATSDRVDCAQRVGMTVRQRPWASPSLPTPSMPSRRGERPNCGVARAALRTGRSAGTTGGHALGRAGLAMRYRLAGYGPDGRRLAFIRHGKPERIAQCGRSRVCRAK